MGWVCHAAAVKGTAAMSTGGCGRGDHCWLLSMQGSRCAGAAGVGRGKQGWAAKNPISLHDFLRVGGAGVGRAKVNLRINSNDTIVDHTWIWGGYGAGVVGTRT